MNKTGVAKATTGGSAARKASDPAKAALEKLNAKTEGRTGVAGGAARTAGAAAAGAAGATKMSKAVGGGVQGAVLEGVRASLRKGNRKLWLVVALPTLIPLVAVTMVLVLVMSLGSSNQGGSEAAEIGQSVNIAKADGLSQDDYDSYIQMQDDYGIPWQIMAALHQAQSTQQAASGNCDPSSTPVSSPSPTSTPAPSPSSPGAPSASAKFVHPSTKSPVHITSGFGARDTGIPGATTDHKGIDIGVPMGTPLVAVGDGTVVYADQHGPGTYGGLVIIRLDEGSELRYAHMSEVDVHKGQRVAPKVQVGKSGFGGSGPHLHFETIPNVPLEAPVDWMYRTYPPQDPVVWLKAHGVDPYTGTAGGTITATPADCIPSEPAPTPGGPAPTATSPVASPAADVPAAPAATSTAAPSPTDTATSASPSPSSGPSDGSDASDGEQYISEWKIPAKDLTDDQKKEFASNKNAATRWVAQQLQKIMLGDPAKSNHMAMGTGLQIDPETDTRSIDPDSDEAKVVASAWTDGIDELNLGGMNQDAASAVWANALAWYLGKHANTVGQAGSGLSCAPPSGAQFTVASSTRPNDKVVMNPKRMGYAASIYGTAKSQGVTDNGMIAVFMVVLQESHFNMYANSRVPESLSFPHDLVGSDGLSVGLFQQQAGYGWGTVAEDMDPGKSTLAFLGKLPGATAPGMLAKVPGYESLPPGTVAQKVQASAFPDAYDQWLTAAKTVVAAMAGVSCTGSGDGSGASYKNYQIPAGGCTSCVKAALNQLGVPYAWGGGTTSGPSRGISYAGIDGTNVVGFDCSSLMMYAWWQGAHMQIPRTASPQMQMIMATTPLTMNYRSLPPGALLFFHPTGPGRVGHAGMWMGNDLMVEAPQPGDVVKVVPMSTYIKYTTFVGGGMIPGYSPKAGA